ncbi:transmembrane protein, putative (macronuclear) [Tetrahymena thermophila SB210]|uniref:Transmembrane protein, putative n=1 Tax=Tetrahymena thermophila (strain SB210) TaxID=312017 RepID=Q235E9_TETTS|nr:transmembrane protein, putative [Tetrahymena thermophila SB210]EAR92154.2 transmembrane protein, putative [Tetrahymena thermophila SB210]|eukprot:XP_001012399.2 transmembrane protein, putative [Tetrahymena thermophila SB210]
MSYGFGKISEVTAFSVSDLTVDIKTISSLNDNFYDLLKVSKFIMKDCNFGMIQKNQGQEKTYQNQKYSNFLKFQSNDVKNMFNYNCSIEIENIIANFNNLNVRFLLINNDMTHQTVIKNSQFSHMKSLDSGGCIKNWGFGILQFTNTTFDSCQSDMFGGALYTGTLSITDEIKISNCKSKIGGGAFLGNKAYQQIDYDKIKYFNNSATVSSQQYFICTSQPDDRMMYNCNLFEFDSIYELNAELVNTEYHQKKMEDQISYADFHVEIHNASVYKNLLYVIRFRVEYECAEKNFKQKCVVREFDENQSIGNLYNYLKNDTKQYFMNNDLPDANYPYLLTSYSLQYDCKTSYGFIDLFYFLYDHTSNSRRVCFHPNSKCEKGMEQIFNMRQNEMQCKYCDSGTYNDQTNSNCQVCDKQTFDKCYADVSYLKQNFWRPQNSQFNDTYSCQLNQKSCNGDSRTGYGNQLCSEGYIGAQCLTCDIKGEFWEGESYGQQGYFKCVKCSSVKNNNLYIYLSDCLALFMFFFTIISSFKRMRAQIYRKYLSFYMKKIYIGYSFVRQKQASVYMKILLFNFQMYLLTYYFVDFNQYDSSIHSSIYNFFNPLQSSDGVSYDCFLKEYFPNSESLGFIKLLISVFCPLILNTFILLLVTIYSQIRKKNYYFLLISSFLYSIIFVFQPSIIQYSIESITCIQLTSRDSYLMIDTTINCNDQSWRSLMYAVSIPALVIYVFAIPLIFFGYIFQNRKQLEKIPYYQPWFLLEKLILQCAVQYTVEC